MQKLTKKTAIFLIVFLMFVTFVFSTGVSAATATEQELSLTKVWKTTEGTTVGDENIPFDKVEVEIVQYYKVTENETTIEREINSDTLVLTKTGSWTDIYGKEVRNYGQFKAIAERVYIGDQLVTKDTFTDYEDWTMGEFVFSRNYGNSSAELTGRETTCANKTITIPGNGLALVKLTSDSGFIIWMPYLKNIDTDARTAIKQSVVNASPNGSGNINLNDIKFYDEVENSMTGVTVTFLYEGNVQLAMDGSSVWSQVWYGPFEFTDNTISASLENRLNTNSTTEIVIKKIWNDDNNFAGKRPGSIDIDVLGGGTTIKGVTLTGEGNEWQTNIAVPKYNTDGSKVLYTIEEKVPDNYEATYNQNELTVTNSPKNVLLTVEKNVEGNLGDRNLEFVFTLKLSKDESPFTDNIRKVTSDSETELLANGEGEYSFTLKHGESIQLKIPYGCTYTLAEKTGTEYETTVQVDDGLTTNAKEVTNTLNGDSNVHFKNIKNGIIDTGFVQTSLPFVVLSAITFAGASILILNRKRRFND